MASSTAMDVLSLPAQPLNEQIEALEHGLPSNTLAKIAEAFGMPKARIIQALKLAQRTVTEREKRRARLSPVESERLYRLVRLRALARNVFSTDAAVAQWLTEPDRSLGHRTPLEMLSTDLGSQKVENLVRAMMHGVPV